MIQAVYGHGGSQTGHFRSGFRPIRVVSQPRKTEIKNQTDIEPEQPGTELIHKQGVIPSIRGNRNDDMFAFSPVSGVTATRREILRYTVLFSSVWII